MYLNSIGYEIVSCSDLTRDRKKLRNNESLKKDLASRNYLVTE